MLNDHIANTDLINYGCEVQRVLGTFRLLLGKKIFNIKMVMVKILVTANSLPITRTKIIKTLAMTIFAVSN